MKLRLLILAAMLPFSALASVSLHPMMGEGFNQNVAQAAAQLSLSGASLIEKQVFEVKDKGQKLGTLIAAEGYNQSDNPVCFIAWADKQDAVTAVIPTIGFQQWEAETCFATSAIGVVSRSEATARVGVIYAAKSPNADATEALVLDLSAEGIQLNTALTGSASTAGIKTLGALKALVKGQ